MPVKIFVLAFENQVEIETARKILGPIPKIIAAPTAQTIANNRRCCLSGNRPCTPHFT